MAKQIDLFSRVSKKKKYEEIEYSDWKVSLANEAKERSTTREPPGVGLDHEDMKALGAGKKRVLKLMLDGQWHTAAEIRGVAGGSEGLRRLRELRKQYVIEKRRTGSTPKTDLGLGPRGHRKRHYEYRLVQKIMIGEDPNE